MASITEFLNQFQGQGSIFWVAAFSMAAGATLLLVSGLVMARRGMARGLSLAGGGIRRPSFTLGKGKEKAAGPMVELTDTGYKANTLTTAPEAPRAESAPPAAGDGELFDRLRQAANTLEEIHRALKSGEHGYGISAITANGRDVDYVFKSGIS